MRQLFFTLLILIPFTCFGTPVHFYNNNVEIGSNSASYSNVILELTTATPSLSGQVFFDIATGRLKFSNDDGTTTYNILYNTEVIDQILTGFSSGSGVLVATDSILEGIQKLDGNIVLNDSDIATLTSSVTLNISNINIVEASATLNASNITTVNASATLNASNLLIVNASATLNASDLLIVNASATLNASNIAALSTVNKFISDISLDGTPTLTNIDTSGDITDARNAIIQFKDNTNAFEVMGVNITATEGGVTITSTPALDAGSYRLILLEIE